MLLQAMKDWHKFKAGLFKKQQYDCRGCDTTSLPSDLTAVKGAGRFIEVPFK
jgi:hypothetical protein